MMSKFEGHVNPWDVRGLHDVHPTDEESAMVMDVIKNSFVPTTANKERDQAAATAEVVEKVGDIAANYVVTWDMVLEDTKTVLNLLNEANREHLYKEIFSRLAEHLKHQKNSVYVNGAEIACALTRETINWNTDFFVVNSQM